MTDEQTPTPGPRFRKLQRAISDYGAAAFQNLLRSKALAEAAVGGFPAYVGCDPALVSLVPAEGPFDPRKTYGDAAFSFSARKVIVLEPVRFGIALIVGNREDSGSLWLRTAIAAEISGAFFDVFVAARPVVRLPLAFEGRLEPLHRTIYEEFLDTFELEVLEFNDSRFRSGIGFLGS